LVSSDPELLNLIFVLAVKTANTNTMQIEERIYAFFTRINNYETILKGVVYCGAILIAYNYFFYLSLVGMAVGIPLYYYIQTQTVREVVPPQNTVLLEPKPTIQIPA